MTLLRAALLCASPTAYEKTKSVSADDKLQAASYPDVQRLCNNAIPDETKIRACMEGKRFPTLVRNLDRQVLS